MDIWPKELVDQALASAHALPSRRELLTPLKILADEVERLREDLEVAKVERDGANKRAQMMLEQKDHFRTELEKWSRPLGTLEPAAMFKRSMVELAANVDALVKAARGAQRICEDNELPFTAGKLAEALKPFEEEP